MWAPLSESQVINFWASHTFDAKNARGEPASDCMEKESSKFHGKKLVKTQFLQTIGLHIKIACEWQYCCYIVYKNLEYVFIKRISCELSQLEDTFFILISRK